MRVVARISGGLGMATLATAAASSIAMAQLPVVGPVVAPIGPVTAPITAIAPIGNGGNSGAGSNNSGNALLGGSCLILNSNCGNQSNPTTTTTTTTNTSTTNNTSTNTTAIGNCATNCNNSTPVTNNVAFVDPGASHLVVIGSRAFQAGATTVITAAIPVTTVANTGGAAAAG